MKYIREQYTNEDMLAPVGSLPQAGAEASGPGLLHQKPSSLSGDMDMMSLVGPGKDKKGKLNDKKDDTKPKKKKGQKSYVVNKVLSFGDFMQDNA